MFTLFHGMQYALVKARLTRILTDRLGKPGSYERIDVDARETTIQEIAQLIMQVSLSTDKRAIIVEHCYFVHKKKTKEKIEKEQDYDTFIQLVNVIPQDTEVLFIAYTDELDNKSAFIHHIERLGQITAIASIDAKQWPDFIKRYFESKNRSIAYDATLELSKRVGEDVQLFFTYADKLLINQEPLISLAMIVSQIPRSMEENIFELTNALVKQEINQAMQIYRDLRIRNEEPVTLLQLFSRHFRLMQMVTYLNQQGSDYLAISKQLRVHEYRIKLMLQHKRTFTLPRLEKIQQTLFDLDVNIKRSVIDRFVGFELFLLNFNQLIS
jgi:DNA polymerase-3 subunit delta